MAISKKSISSGRNKFLVKLKDRFLMDDFLDKLKDILPDAVLYPCEDLESFMDNALSQDLYREERKIVVLRRLRKEDIQELCSVLDSGNEDVWVFFECDTLPKNKAYTELRGSCEYVELKNPSTSRLAVKVRKHLSDEGLSFDEEIPSYIVSKSNRGPGLLHGDVRKLCLLCRMRDVKKVGKDLCDEVAISSQEPRFFDFIEDYFKRRTPKVMETVQNVDEYSFVKLLHFMIGQAQRIYEVAICKEKQMENEEIAGFLGVSPYIIKTKYCSVLPFYGKIRLMKLLDVLNEADAELRWSKYPKRLVFESYLMKGLKV